MHSHSRPRKCLLFRRVIRLVDVLKRVFTACLLTRLYNIFTRTLFHALQVFDPTSVPIQTVTYSLTVTGNTFTTHVARPAVGGSVTVETATPVAGTVVITVDQSARTA